MATDPSTFYEYLCTHVAEFSGEHYDSAPKDLRPGDVVGRTGPSYVVLTRPEKGEVVDGRQTVECRVQFYPDGGRSPRSWFADEDIRVPVVGTIPDSEAAARSAGGED